MLGHPDSAQAMMDTALVRAQKLSHGHTETFALCYQATLHQYSGNAALAAASAKMAIDVASEHSIRQWLAWGTILSGWALAIEGQIDEGLERLQEGLDSWRVKELFAVPYFLGLKAEVLGAAERFDEGIASLRMALEISGKGNQCFYVAELHRLKSVLLQKQGHVDEAEDCLQRGLELARKQKAKSIELRIAIILGRLWKEQNKVAEAHKLLDGVSSWFTEGFDTADIRKAKVIMEELA